jgi:hypothetical protein
MGIFGDEKYIKERFKGIRRLREYSFLLEEERWIVKVNLDFSLSIYPDSKHSVSHFEFYSDEGMLISKTGYRSYFIEWEIKEGTLEADIVSIVKGITKKVPLDIKLESVKDEEVDRYRYIERKQRLFD